MLKTDPQHAIRENILFQAESWQRYGHNGLDNKIEDCDIWLYKIEFSIHSSAIKIEKHHFSKTSGYSLVNDKPSLLSTSRKDINKVSKYYGSDIHWESWCEGSKIKEFSLAIKKFVKYHKQALQKEVNKINIPKTLSNR